MKNEEKKPRNPNAFPTPPETAYEYNEHGQTTGNQDGMTLRDYFAAKAMQGFLSNNSIVDDVNSEAIEWTAARSYLIAEAMLKAREL